jgi:hypothetical protein
MMASFASALFRLASIITSLVARIFVHKHMAGHHVQINSGFLAGAFSFVGFTSAVRSVICVFFICNW